MQDFAVFLRKHGREGGGPMPVVGGMAEAMPYPVLVGRGRPSHTEYPGKQVPRRCASRNDKLRRGAKTADKSVGPTWDMSTLSQGGKLPETSGFLGIVTSWGTALERNVMGATDRWIASGLLRRWANAAAKPTGNQVRFGL